MSIQDLNSAETSHILGIDFGQARVGLALADNVTKIAFAYAVLANDEKMLQKIAGICEKERVKKIIIGVPTYINKKSVEYEGKKLGKLIKKIFPEIEIEYHNEMFTTKMAKANLIEKGARSIKKYDDMEAARIILQSWLDLCYNESVK